MPIRALVYTTLALPLFACNGGGPADDSGEADAYPNTRVVAGTCTGETNAWLPANDSFWPEGWVQYNGIAGPYEIRAVTATLVAGEGLAGGEDCDPRVGLEIAVWVSDDETPMDYANGADPMTVPDLGGAVVMGTMAPTAEYTTEEVTLTLDTPIEVLEGQRLFVGYRDTGATGTACLAACEGSSVGLWQHDPDSTDGTYVYESLDDTTVPMMGATIATP